MRKVHEKSIILGIGIGMIITSIAGLIYSAGTDNKPTKEEIITLAKSYGMVEKTTIIDDSDATAAAPSTAAQSSAARSSQTNSKPAETKKAASQESAAGTSAADTKAINDKDRNITITIKDGDKSQNVIDQLIEEGVITSEQDFVKVLDSYGASTKINIGNYKFKKNEDLNYVVKTICSIK